MSAFLAVGRDTTMTCREYKGRLETLEDYSSGRLDATASDRVAAHLATCLTCREAVESATLAGRILRAGLEPAGTPGGQFWFRVLAGIRQEQDHSLQFWRPLEILARRMALGASLALLVLTGFVLTQELTPGQRDATATTLVPGAVEGEVRELFPEPVQQPVTRDEVLLSLANTGPVR